MRISTTIDLSDYEVQEILEKTTDEELISELEARDYVISVPFEVTPDVEKIMQSLRCGQDCTEEIRKYFSELTGKIL